LGWTIEYDPEAIKDLHKLNRSIRSEILSYMQERIAQAENPRNFGKPLRYDNLAYGATGCGIFASFASCRKRGKSCWSSASVIARMFTNNLEAE
jgi:hypothetical protein